MYEPGSAGRWRRHASLLAFAAPLLVAAGVGGCAREAHLGQPTTTTSVQTTGDAASYGVDALRLRFALPTSFVAVDNRDFAFLARSDEPMAIFSIDREEPGITDHDAEAGESVSDSHLDDVDAKLVTNAVVDGLPPGIAANELLVDNGSRSFSVIMSASPGDLAGMWQTFIASLHVEPA
ncbi:MAG TPA: hypothetical protein VKB55_01190 [Nocardioidaceae bacterium]|nr:hypothetical protein [Nocardioidaceae bacterium]